ncbi:MAG: CopD family protein [Desulfuromonadales bacterium]|nr:CopD family protein [Desulfuromonadales bacterium]
MARLLLQLVMVFILGCPLTASATEEYARQTGQSCEACHVDPSGGGELKPAGKAFAATLRTTPEKPALSAAARWFRFSVGYLHLLTAFLWFGTILYVHLVLKPAYASSGLPRGEMRVGVGSMAVMGITGIILTHFRVGSPELLLQSRFGILLLIKIGLYLIMVVSAAFVIIVIGPRLKRKRLDPSPAAPVGGDMSAEELALCDGKEGHPVMFACQGTIYNASASRLWKQGSHMGRHQSGRDLTAALAQAPHGMELVTALPAVGQLVAGTQRRAPLHERVFFFMAYMNLTIVFLVILILALWRWW